MFTRARGVRVSARSRMSVDCSVQYPSRGVRIGMFNRLYFRWCVAEPCYQYQWVVRDGDVFCQRSDGLRVDSKTVLYFSLINKIMFSISSTRPTLWEQKRMGSGKGRSKKCRQQTGEPRNIVTESSVVLTSPCFENDTQQPLHVYIHT